MKITREELAYIMQHLEADILTAFECERMTGNKELYDRAKEEGRMLRNLKFKLLAEG